jgi:hypothetical protein
VLDREIGGHGEWKGPFENTLDRYGRNGRVLVPVIGAFAEMSDDVSTQADFVASAQADLHCSRFSEDESLLWRFPDRHVLARKLAP